MKKLLIVEDDGDTLELLGYLSAKSNFDVVLRTDVLPLKEVQDMNPDFILLDHWLGEKSGGQFCLDLKRNPATGHIPIVIMSAAVGVNQVAVDSRADGFIAKPFDLGEIKSVFECYLGETVS